MFRRIDNRAHAYAPIGLPPTYDVVKDGGEIVTPDQYGFETDQDAKVRADSQEHVWNDIWKRRIVYFATVAATLWLLAFPPAGRLGAPIRRVWSAPSAGYPISSASSAASCPDSPKPGSTAMRAVPSQFLALLLLVAGLIWLGTRIASRISDRMGAISARNLPGCRRVFRTTGIYRLRSNPRYIALHQGLKLRWAPAFFCSAVRVSRGHLWQPLALQRSGRRWDLPAQRETGRGRRAYGKGESSRGCFCHPGPLQPRTGIFVEAGCEISRRDQGDGRSGAMAAFRRATPRLLHHGRTGLVSARALLMLGVPLRRELTPALVPTGASLRRDRWGGSISRSGSRRWDDRNRHQADAQGRAFHLRQ